MRYYQIDTLRQSDPEFVFLREMPSGTAGMRPGLSHGDPMAAWFPADARLEMSSKSSGIVLPSVIGNTQNLLIVARPLKDVFEGAKVPIECFPFTLLDPRKRVMSRDYFIVNPLGGFDCIDYEASKIVYFDEDPSVIISIKTLVLDPKKMENAPDFFRVDREPYRYVISERLGRQLQPLDPTNLVVNEIPVSAGK